MNQERSEELTPVQQDLIQVDHDLIPANHKVPVKQDLIPANRGPFGGMTDDVVRALTVTRFSRLQLLKGLAAASAVAMLPSLPARGAFAQTGSGSTVNAPGSRVARDAWKAAWYLEFANKPIKVREAIVLSMIGQSFLVNPQANPAEVVKAAVKFREVYNREVMQGKTLLYQGLENAEHLLSHALKALESAEVQAQLFGTVGGSVNVGKVVSSIYQAFTGLPAVKNKVSDVLATWANEEQIKKVSEWSDTRIEDVLNGTLDGALQNTRWLEAVDGALVNTALVSLENIQTKDPKLVVEILEPIIVNLKPESAQKIRDKINSSSDGSLAITIKELEEMVQKELDAIKGKMDEQLTYISSIDAKQTLILEWVIDQEKRRKREEERQQHQLQMDGLNSAVYLISTLVGIGDPNLGKQMQVVGSSAIQIYDSVWKFADGLDNFSGSGLEKLFKMGDLSELFSFSGAIMTGNIVGAVMNIISLFAEQGPTPEQMILDEIGKLQQQVGRLHQEMHERFDRIEKYLDTIFGGINAIFEVVNARFDQISKDLEGVRREIEQIQQELARQELLLNRLGVSVHKGLQDGFRHDFFTAFNSALGYKQKNGVDMSVAQFNDWEGEFYTWAIVDAKNENEQPVKGRSYEDDFVFSELEGYPLEENVMYLSNWLKERAGFSPLTSAPLVNRTTWGISAWAYGQLRVENPKYAVTGTYPNRNADVEQEGDKLRSALRRITVKRDTSNGPEPNQELFDWLIANYKEKAEELDGALKAIESKYLNDQTLSKVDAWGGAQQKIDHVPASFPSNAPSNILSFVPAPYLLADYLELGDLSMRVKPEWAEYQEDGPWWTGEKRPCQDEEGNVRDCYRVSLTGILLVTVSVKYKDTTLLARYVNSDPMYAGFRDYNYDGYFEAELLRDPQQELDAAWEGGIKAKFEASSEESAPSDEEKAQREQLLSNVTNEAEAKLRELRAAIYQKMGVELEDGQSLHPPTRRLSGAKALIDAFVSLGMPLALQADDFLRSLLYGTQSLVDRRQVQERYSAAYADAKPDGKNEQGSTNARDALKKDADARADALGGSLKGYLKLIGEKNHGEVQQVIESTLVRSQAMSAVVKAFNQAQEQPPTPPPVIVPPKRRKKRRKKGRR